MTKLGTMKLGMIKLWMMKLWMMKLRREGDEVEEGGR
jgi:hypothetical protein